MLQYVDQCNDHLIVLHHSRVEVDVGTDCWLSFTNTFLAQPCNHLQVLLPVRCDLVDLALQRAVASAPGLSLRPLVALSLEDL